MDTQDHFVPLKAGEFCCTPPVISLIHSECATNSWGRLLTIPFLTVILLSSKSNITFYVWHGPRASSRALWNLKEKVPASVKLETGDDQLSHLAFDSEVPPLGVTLRFPGDRRRLTGQSRSFALTSYSEWLGTQAEMAVCLFHRYIDYLISVN